MEAILPLIYLLVSLLRPSVMTGFRLTGAQAIAACIVALSIWAPVWMKLCEVWASLAVPRWGDWLPPALIKFFFVSEIVVAPFIDCLILYSCIAFWIILLYVPAEVSDQEAPRWRNHTRNAYRRKLRLFLIVYVLYLAATLPWRDLSGFGL